MKICAIGFDFMLPYIRSYCELVEDARDADFVLTMNNAGAPQIVAGAREAAHDAGKPLCWWTIEDPNSLAGFMSQARMADFVFTSDKACIPHYRRQCGHDRVFWLPLAACEELHRPLPLADDAADFVFSGNWYDRQWEARRWGTETAILPLARAGYSMAIFSYEEPPYPELKGFWRGATSCYTVAEQYRHGKIVLGNNNQRTGMDGRGPTYMTSMRTTEALACGKAQIAPQSDAYEALDIGAGLHMVSVDSPTQALQWAEHLLTNEDSRQSMGEEGRQLVLACHTYRHRLERISKALAGEAHPAEYE